jgi:hypothetical protein
MHLDITRGDLEAYEDDAPFAARRGTLSIPRKLL